VTTRDRRPDDLPELGRLLGEQQPGSAYPFRWPLPFPVEDFLVRPGELVARVAVETGPAGALLGHVSVLEPVEDVVGTALHDATGRTDLGVVSVLFTSVAARGRGVGSLLLADATRWAREHGLLPVLDVVATHRGAVDLYLRKGWVEVGTARPAWLPDDEPPVLLMAAPPA